MIKHWLSSEDTKVSACKELFLSDIYESRSLLLVINILFVHTPEACGGKRFLIIIHCLSSLEEVRVQYSTKVGTITKYQLLCYKDLVGTKLRYKWKN